MTEIALRKGRSVKISGDPRVSSDLELITGPLTKDDLVMSLKSSRDPDIHTVISGTHEAAESSSLLLLRPTITPKLENFSVFAQLHPAAWRCTVTVHGAVDEEAPHLTALVFR